MAMATGPGSRTIENQWTCALLASPNRVQGGGDVTTANDFSITEFRFLKPADVTFGNDQHMGRCFGVDILEGVGVLIVVDFFRWNFATHDFAK